MSSAREFVANELVPSLIEDAKELRIFNEADLQYWTAYHIFRDYVRKHPNTYLLNQPYIRIGKGRGATSARPDLVIADSKQGPITAIELKCFLEDADLKFTTIRDKVWEDIEALRKFKQRFDKSEYAFAIIMIDVTDIHLYNNLCKEFDREKESWMKHYLKVHLINMFCDEDGRKRTRYEDWAEGWLDRLDQFKGMT